MEQKHYIYNYSKILKLTLPMIGMMIVTSIYGIVDGIFVSNCVGKTPFAALNLIMPFIMVLSVFGFMIGSGGTALVSKTQGEGREEDARRYFSMLVYTTIALGLVFGGLSEIFLPQIAGLLGAEGETLTYSVMYGRVLSGCIVFAMLQYSFQSFLACAGKPKMAFILSIAAGVTNMIGDFLFVYVFQWGLIGAASATVLSWTVGSLIPLIYFLAPNHSTLRLGKTKPQLRIILAACYNGLSEMITNISFNIASILFNHQLLSLYGNDGVVAYGVIMYVSFIFVGVYSGFTMGISPLIAYQYGAKNKDEITNLIQKSLKMIAGAALVLTGLAELTARPCAMIFTSYDESLLDLSTLALRVFSFSFLLSGFNIFASAFFTSLNNGNLSALISLLRTFLFQVICIFVLPLIFPKESIWCSVIVSEFICIFVSFFIMFANQKKYGYRILMKHNEEDNLII